MHIGSGELSDALHDMVLDDLAELVPPGQEGRIPMSGLRDEVTARHAAAKEAAKRPYQKWDLTPEREAVIRARYDGRSSTIRAIADDLGVPWYTVRDWANGRLQLRNGADEQPNGLGNLKPVKPKTTPQRRDANMGTFTPVKPTAEERSEIEAAREKRNALIASASPDDAIPADSATGWLTPRWTFTDELGAIIAAQWDGSDASLACLAEREHMPLGVLRTWVKQYQVIPQLTPEPEPEPERPAEPVAAPPTPPATRPSSAADGDPHWQRFTDWLDGAVGGSGLSVFLVRAMPAEVLVLHGDGGYRVLTPHGDWPDEPLSRKLVERIVRLLASGASDLSVYGVVYRAEA